MKTAGPMIPTNGIKIEGSKLEANSLVISYFNKSILILYNYHLLERDKYH